MAKAELTTELFDKICEEIAHSLQKGLFTYAKQTMLEHPNSMS